MRNVILQALQTGELTYNPEFNSSTEEFKPDVSLIINNHVIPRLDYQTEMLKKCALSYVTSLSPISPKPVSLILTTEDITGLGWFLLADPALFTELVIKSAQIVEERISSLAKELNVYIAACYCKRIDNNNYNVTSIFKPDGQICGEYRKTHIPPNEMWQITDGEDMNIIETDFGKIGVLICYDMMFPDAASVLGVKGAEIILHPTAGYGWYDSIGEATLRTRANDNSVYILTAKNHVQNGAGKSSLIDPWGHVLVDAGFYKDVIISKEIDLDIPKIQPEWFYQSQMSGYHEIKKRVPHERRPELYNELCKNAERLNPPDEEKRKTLIEKIRTGECRWN